MLKNHSLLIAPEGIEIRDSGAIEQDADVF